MARTIRQFVQIGVLVVLASFGLGGLAFGQTISDKVRIESGFDSGTFERTYKFDGSNGLTDSVTKSSFMGNTTTFTFVGTEHWSSRVSLSLDTVASSLFTDHYITGQTRTSSVTNQGAGSRFIGSGQSGEMSELYERSWFTLNMGVNIRLEHETVINDQGPGFSHARSTTNYTYLSPVFGSELHHTLWRFPLRAAGSVLPVMRYGKTTGVVFEDSAGTTVSNQSRVARSYGFSWDVSAGYEILKNKLTIQGGWRQTSIETKRAKQIQDQENQWRAFYISAIVR